MKRGHSTQSEVQAQRKKAQVRQLDPLKPSRWKNEEGTKYRKETNAKARERKQDLCIMIDTICNKPAAANAFHKLVTSGKTQKSTMP